VLKQESESPCVIKVVKINIFLYAGHMIIKPDGSRKTKIQVGVWGLQ
jgi:hypothetical protein